MPTTEYELDVVHDAIGKQQRRGRLLTKVSVALPVLVALGLYSFVGRSAVHYQQQLKVAESNLKQAREELAAARTQPVKPPVRTNPPPKGPVDELTALRAERDKINADIATNLNALTGLQKQCSDGLGSLNNNLTGADGSLTEALAMGNLRKQRLAKVIAYLKSLGQPETRIAVNRGVGPVIDELSKLEDESGSVGKAKEQVEAGRGNSGACSDGQGPAASALTKLQDDLTRLTKINTEIIDALRSYS